MLLQENVQDYSQLLKRMQESCGKKHESDCGCGCSDKVEEKKKMDNPCQKGYVAYGTKKKNGKEVPNCVPKNENKIYEPDQKIELSDEDLDNI